MMTLSALTTVGKLSICLIFLLVVLAVEVVAFIGLFKWKKKAMQPAATSQPQSTEPTAQATEQSAETTEQPAQATEQPAETTEQPAQATEQPAETTEQSAEATEQPVEATEQSAQTTEQVADDKKKLYSVGAFLPFALLSASSGAAPLRGFVYTLAIICILGAVGAMALSIVFAMQISKKKPEPAQQSEQTPAEEPAQETAEPESQPEPEPVAEPQPEPVVEPEPEPQPEPEPVVEPEPEPEPQPVVVETTEEVPAEEEEEEDEEEENRIFVETDDGGYFIILERTFTARLIQAKKEVKDYYSQIKNALLSFKKVNARMSKKRESFRSGKATIARMMIRGKTLRLYLALDPAMYADAKYKVEDKSYVVSHADCSLMLRVNSERKCEFAVELIEDLAANFNLIPDSKFEEVDYTAQMPYESTDELVEKGLIVKKLAKGTSLFDSKVVDVLSAEDEKDTHVDVDSDPISDEDSDIVDIYERSFTAKLMQSDVSVKQFYSLIKNHLLSYGKVNARMTKKREVFRFGKVVVARMSLRSKTLRLYLALDFNKYKDGKFLVEDASSVKAVEDTPVLYRIANERRSRFAKELIDEMLKSLGAEQGERTNIDYTADLPYKTDEELFHQGLIVIKNVADVTDKK